MHKALKHQHSLIQKCPACKRYAGGAFSHILTNTIEECLQVFTLPPQTRRNRLRCHSHAFEVAEMWYIPLPRPPAWLIDAHRIVGYAPVVMLVGPPPLCDVMHDVGGKAKI